MPNLQPMFVDATTVVFSCEKCGENTTRWFDRMTYVPTVWHCPKCEQLARHGCCDKAQVHPCVCYYSTECPEHGIRHIGTHD